MRNWTSQIVIGVIVTVIGTLIANALTRGNGRHFFPGFHKAGFASDFGDRDRSSRRR